MQQNKSLKSQTENISKQLQNLSLRLQKQNTCITNKIQQTQTQIKNMKHFHELKILKVSKQTQQQILVVKKEIKEIYGVLDGFKVTMKQFQNTLKNKLDIIIHKNQKLDNWKQRIQQRMLQVQQRGIMNNVDQLVKHPYYFSDTNCHQDFKIVDGTIIYSASNLKCKIALIEPKFQKNIDKYNITFKIQKCNSWIGIGICHIKSIKEMNYNFQPDIPHQEIYLMTHNGYILSGFGQNLWNVKTNFSGFNFGPNMTLDVNVDSSTNKILFIIKNQSCFVRYSPNIDISDMCFCVYMNKKNNRVSIQGYIQK